jgi:hypothetical protein
MAAEIHNLREHLKAVASRLETLAHGETTRFVREEAARLGLSPQTLWRRLREEAGWTSGRKPRADKGRTRVNEESLLMIATLKKTATRLNNKATMPTTVAVPVTVQNGFEVPVSASQVNRLLKARRLDTRSQQAATPHTAMQSPYPNHTHQVDVSLCVVYYLRGKQYAIRAEEFYKNKLDKVAKLKFRVYRYALWDHASSYIVPWYVEARGETQHNLFEFLLFAWGEQPGRAFHGVPEVLIWDKGSANDAHAIANLLDALDVTAIAHKKGNARAKGGVEGAHNLIETQFESRLRVDPVDSLDELNAAACAWANAYNADRIPGQDTRLRRRGIPPTARLYLWLTLTDEQLRRLPDAETCRALMRGASVMRKVHGDLTIQYKHPQATKSRDYDLTGLAGVCVNDWVKVSPLVYGRCAVVIRRERYDGQVLEDRLEPIEDFTRYGQRADAPVWGERYAAKPDTEADTAAKAMDHLAYGDIAREDIQKAKDRNEAPFAYLGGLDAHRHLQAVEIPTTLPRRGRELGVTVPHLEPVTLSPVQMAKRLMAALGEAWTPAYFAELERRYPDKRIPEADEETLLAELRADGEPVPKPALKVVK